MGTAESGYLLRPWATHLGNWKPKVKRSSVTLQCDKCRSDVQRLCSVSHTHVTERKMAVNSYQVSPGSSQDVIPPKVHENLMSQGITICILEMKELRPMEVKRLALLAHSPTGRDTTQSTAIWKPHTKACERGAKPSSFIPRVFLLRGPWAIFQFIFCNLLGSGKLHVRLRWEDYEEKASYLT